MPPPSRQTIEEKTLEYLTFLRETASSEVARVHSAYVWFASAIGVFAGLVLAAGTYLFYNNINDFKRDFRDDGKRIIDIQLASLTNAISDQLRTATNQIGKDVNRMIVEMFEINTISNLVASEARIRVDKIANTIISNAVKGEAAALQLQLASNFSDASSTISNSVIGIEAKLAAFNKDLEFSVLALSAQSDGRTAWEKIYRMAFDPNEEKQVDARNTFGSSGSRVGDF